MFDVTIIGAGINGSLLAYYLGKYNINVLILEKENDVALGSTGANSAIIHSGHDPKKNTLKCKYNLLGAKLYPSLCKELKVDYKMIGAYVVACGSEEEEKLNVLIDNCIKRNIEYKIFNKEEIRKKEININDNVTKALYLPTTAIITPWQICYACIEEFLLNGGNLKLNYEVKKIERFEDHFLINDEIKTRIIVNCAGVYADSISNMLNLNRYQIKARKGEYYILDHDEEYLNSIIYPLPSEKGKGVLVVPTIDNNILLGPNSEFVEDKNDLSTGAGLDYISKEINKTVKNLPLNKIIHTFAGLRAHSNLDDFYIGEDEDVENFIHVAGIESPGLTSAPSIAKDILDIILKKMSNVTLKENYIKRKENIVMNKLSQDEKNNLIKGDNNFGKIICRCEKISKGEIIDVINRKNGARTIKGIKMRCRPGMGRCQGGFCEDKVLKILASYYQKDIDEIEYDNKGSNLFIAKAKELFDEKI